MTAHAKIEVHDEVLPEWRLDDLFSGRDDPRIEAELADASKANAALVALKGAFVAARSEPERLGALIAEGVDLYERATTRLWAVGAYASLAASVARDDPLWSKFESDIRARSAAIAGEALFFTLELNALDEAEIEAALAVDSMAARYRPWLRRVRLGRPHELDAELERMLLDRAPALANWTRLYDETLGRLTVRAERESLTLAQALNRLSDPDEGRRKRVANGLARALEAQAPVLGLCLNTVALEKQVEDRWRRFADPAGARHLANEVDAEAVRALEDAVVEHYPSISHRYYALKARLMGKPNAQSLGPQCAARRRRTTALQLARGDGDRTRGLRGARPLVCREGKTLLRAALDRRAPEAGQVIRRLFTSGDPGSAPLCVPELHGRAA